MISEDTKWEHGGRNGLNNTPFLFFRIKEIVLQKAKKNETSSKQDNF